MHTERACGRAAGPRLYRGGVVCHVCVSSFGTGNDGPCVAEGWMRSANVSILAISLTDHINVRRLHPRARRSDRGTRGAGGPGGGVVRWHRTPPAAAPAGWRVAALEPAPGAPVPRVASVKLRPPREIDVRSCTCPGGGACTWPVAPDVLAFCLRCVVRLFVRLEKYYGRARPPGNGATRNGTAPIVPAGHAGGYRRRSRNAE